MTLRDSVGQMVGSDARSSNIPLHSSGFSGSIQPHFATLL
jgi:hypothetical protein